MVEGEIHRCDLELTGFTYNSKEWTVIEEYTCKECGARATKKVEKIYNIDEYSANL